MDFFAKLSAVCPTIMGAGALTCWSDCPAGWENLVTDISRRLEIHARQHNQALTVDQIKSKFGQLRYYVSASDPIADQMIEEAEQKSITICEECGAPGVRNRSRKWIMTVCEQHNC